MTLRLGGDGAITGCTSLEEPTLSVSGLLVTTPIVATSGTVAAPSYTFTGDTNTGFYQPNGDAIGVSLAGVERAILDSSSNNSWLLIKSTASTGDSAELFLGNSYSEGSISYSHGTGNTNRNLMFKTAGTEKMRLDSYGNLGLGVSPNNVNNFKTFTLNGTTGGNIEFQDQGTLIGSIYNLTDQFIIQGQGSTIPVAFRTNSTERMRIDSSGRMLVNTTTSRIVEDNSGNAPQGKIQIEGLNSDAILSIIAAKAADSHRSGCISLGAHRGSVGGTPTILQNNDTVGAILFAAGDGTDMRTRSAQILSQVDGTPGSNDMPGRLVFSTTADGASSPTERMRIDSSGNIEFRNAATAVLKSVDTSGSSATDYGQFQFQGVRGADNDTQTYLTIDSSGNFGIGTSSPYSVSATGNSLNIANTSSSAEINFLSSTTGFNALYFGDGATGTDRYRGYLEYAHNGDFMRFATGTVERMRIDSSGNVGIGTSSPTAFGPTLQVAGSDPCFLVQDTQSVVDYFGTNVGSGLVTNWYDDAAAWRIGTATGIAGSSYSEKMRIDSSGNVGIGISDPGTMLQVANSSDDGNIRVGGNNSGTTGLTISYSNGGSTATTILQNYRSTNSDALLKFDAGYLTFHTGTSGSERMRIYSSGFIGIGTTAAEPHSGSYNGSGLQIHNETTGKGVNLRLTCDVTGAGAGGGSYLAVDGVNRSFYIYNKESAPIIFGPGNSEKARISSGGKLTVPGVYSNTTTGGSAVYVESDGDLLRFTSSLKYKTDIETLEDVRADAILNCRPVWYRSKCANDIKTEGSDKSDWGWYGFIAEEVAEIEPRLVNWATKNAVLQEDGTNKTVERDPADYEAEGVRYENFVPLLVNLVKRQQIAIETLQAKVAALET